MAFFRKGTLAIIFAMMLLFAAGCGNHSGAGTEGASGPSMSASPELPGSTPAQSPSDTDSAVRQNTEPPANQQTAVPTASPGTGTSSTPAAHNAVMDKVTAVRLI